MKPITTYVLAYGFEPLDGLQTYKIPVPVVVSMEEGKLCYQQKRANLVVLKDYAIVTDDEVQQELLEICTSVSPLELKKKYVDKNKKIKSLTVYLENKAHKKIVKQFLDFKLKRFFELVLQEKFPIFYKCRREEYVEKYRIVYSGNSLVPKFYLKKNDGILEYKLELEHNGKGLLPKNHQVSVLSDTHQLVVVDGVLYRLEDVNGGKVTAFLQKETIRYPQKLEKQFFNTFMKGIVASSHIYPEGFTIQENSVFKEVQLKLVHYFVKDCLQLQLLFGYEYFSFSWEDHRQHKMQLNLKDGEEVSVFKTVRNKEEELNMVCFLEDLGLQCTPENRFEIALEDISIIDWLIDNRQVLEEKLTILTAIVEGKELSLEKSTIEINQTEEMDWFDIHAVIRHGDFQIDFKKIKENLRTKNPYYLLPNGTYFRIPSAWFQRYSSLFAYAEVKGKQLRLPKNKYPLLEALGITTKFNIEIEQKEYVLPSFFKASLRTYQKEGVNWLLHHFENGLGACLADDMGLGKTIQTIAVLAYAKALQENEQSKEKKVQFDLFSNEENAIIEGLGVLIVVPASLIFNWRNELKKFVPSFKVTTYVGATRSKLKGSLAFYDVILTTYQTALRDIEYLRKLRWHSLILDESQYIKNKSSKVFKAINSLEVGHKISLSGTPIENSLADLWSQMEFINPSILGSYTFFKDKFQKPIESNRDEEAISHLKELVDPFIKRRTKMQVAKDLPAVTEQVFYSEMEKEQKDLYEKEKSAVRNQLLKLDEGGKALQIHILKALMHLRQYANHPILVDPKNTNISSSKFTDVINQLETLLASGEKVLIFSSFTSHLELYTNWAKEKNKNYFLLTGATKSGDREAIVREFQEKENTQLFFISLKAGGTGLNLTAASYVFILDPWWNPFMEKQAIARAHRIGQQKMVNVIRFITKDTIEEKILRLQQQKEEIAEEIISTELPTNIGVQELKDIIAI